MGSEYFDAPGGIIDSPRLGKERSIMAEKKSCEFQDRTYPHGGGVCIGDQCIQCNDGSWGPNEFELKEKKRNEDAMLGK